MRTFGCVVHVKEVNGHIRKFEARSCPMVFIGYESGSKAYRVYDPSTRKVTITRDIIFEEEKAWDWGMMQDAEKIPTDDVFHVNYEQAISVGSNESIGEHEPQQTPPTPIHSVVQEEGGESEGETTPESSSVHGIIEEPTSSWEAPVRMRSLHEIYDETEPMQLEYSGLCLLGTEEPTSFLDADKEESWRCAMQEEIDSIRNNQTWSLEDPPVGQRVIGLKWIYKVKKDPDGKVLKHKARLVAKGYVQKQGIDFEEVFAPVARIETVRLLIALAAQEGWRLHHMDVKSAFLNGELEEEVYVKQPPGFEEKGSEHKVLKLHKALYGLKQAPRAWNSKLDSTMLSLGFERSPFEHAVYKKGKGENCLLVGVYVDDLVITGGNEEEVGKFKQQMKEIFKMSDLGLLSYYLGIEVHQLPNGISFCQEAFAKRILQECGMADCNPTQAPMEARLKLSKKSSSPPVNQTTYRGIVGSLRYLTNTRPDLAYSVGIVSRYMESPKTEHMAAVKQILRYVKGTLGMGCHYERRKAGVKLSLVGYSDSDMAGDVDDRKSTTGVVFFLGSNLISWSSRKQMVVALSSCEAEYIAAASAACQGVWLGSLLADLLNQNPDKVMINIDNKSTISLCKNPVHHDRSKHIDTRFHYIRECVEEGKIMVEHVGTNDQLADILTKPLRRLKFIEMRERIGLRIVKKTQQA